MVDEVKHTDYVEIRTGGPADLKTCPYFTEVLTFTDPKTKRGIRNHIRPPCFRDQCELWIHYKYAPYFIDAPYFIEGTSNYDPDFLLTAGCCANKFRAQRAALGIAWRGLVFE